MLVKGKTYVYQYNGYERRGVYLRSTPAWNIFQRDGGEDWLKSYDPYYESEEEKKAVEEISSEEEAEKKKQEEKD